MIVPHTTRPSVGPIPTVIPEPTVYQDAGHDGFRALWVVFALMVLSSALFALLSWNVPVARRAFHVITTLTTIIAAVSYFAMASGHATGYNCIIVRQHHKHVPDTYHDDCREVFWARYVDWSLTTPLLVLELCLLAGVDGAHTLMAIVANLIMTLSGLFSAFGHAHTAQKWGWYAISCVAYLFVIWHVAVHGSRVAKTRGGKVKKLFGLLAVFALILWTVYLVVWGVSGARKIRVDPEIISYAVLDVLTKPVLGFSLLLAQRRNPEIGTEVGGYWSQGLDAEGRIRIGDNEEGA